MSAQRNYKFAFGGELGTYASIGFGTNLGVNARANINQNSSVDLTAAFLTKGGDPEITLSYNYYFPIQQNLFFSVGAGLAYMNFYFPEMEMYNTWDKTDFMLQPAIEYELNDYPINIQGFVRYKVSNVDLTTYGIGVRYLLRK